MLLWYELVPAILTSDQNDGKIMVAVLPECQATVRPQLLAFLRCPYDPNSNRLIYNRDEYYVFVGAAGSADPHTTDGARCRWDAWVTWAFYDQLPAGKPHPYNANAEAPARVVLGRQAHAVLDSLVQDYHRNFAPWRIRLFQHGDLMLTTIDFTHRGLRIRLAAPRVLNPLTLAMRDDLDNAGLRLSYMLEDAADFLEKRADRRVEVLYWLWRRLISDAAFHQGEDIPLVLDKVSAELLEHGVSQTEVLEML